MNPFETYGVPGILIAGIVWLALFLKNLMREHKEERENWQRSNERQNEELNKSINNNTNVLSGLRTLIESLRK